MFRRNQHREIRFAACAGEGSCDVMFLPGRRFDAENQHVLSEPALFARKVRTDAQRQTFFRKEDVPAVTGTNRDDRVVLREMTNEASLRIDIEQRMHSAIPFCFSDSAIRNSFSRSDPSHQKIFSGWASSSTSCTQSSTA